jgi:antitoxin (DNA-binding transcriptional repressor) of toxin-antitoxin stability system
VTTVTIEEAQAKLPELIEHLQPGEEITITDQGKALAQVKKTERTSWPCQAGTAKEKILWIAPDFDGPLDDFKEYME